MTRADRQAYWDRMLYAALKDELWNKAVRFLEKGADPLARKDGDGTALHDVCLSGRVAHGVDREAALSLVRKLIDKGVEVNQVAPNPRDGQHQTPLHCALLPLAKRPPGQVNRALIKVLLEAGADANARMANGATPLGLALCSWRTRKDVRHGNRVMETLLAHGADTNADSFDGAPYLTVALRTLGSHPVPHDPEGAERIELLLKAGADPNRGQKGHQAGNSEPLSLALIFENAPALDLLLAHGADPNGPGEGADIAPLHRAVAMERLAPTEVVASLLKHKADPDVRDCLGGTPLHWAARRGDIDVARLLVDAGGDVNARGENGDTPLHSAAREQGRYALRLSKYLIRCGADPSLGNDAGETPADVLKKRHADLLALYELGPRPEAAGQAQPGVSP